jgi:hypothetical protein
MIRRLVISLEGSPGLAPSAERGAGAARSLRVDGAALVAREFPSVDVVAARAPLELEGPVFHVEEWRDDTADLGRFDARVGAGECESIALVDRGRSGLWTEVAIELLTRYQCFVGRRNAASSAPVFDRVLAAHRALHDLRKPLVHADFLHALDTHAWMLRLAPEAGLAPQIAALFHDVERLVSEAEVRVEQRAADYEAFKRAHARGSARMMGEALARVGVSRAVQRRAEALVERHEAPDGDEELALLNDADALSFFSRNSDGFLRYYGLAHTRKKVTYTLLRMRPASRAWLARARLRPEVRRLVDDALTAARERAPKVKE